MSVETTEWCRLSWVRTLNSHACLVESQAGNSRRACLLSSAIHNRDHELQRPTFTLNLLVSLQRYIELELVRRLTRHQWRLCLLVACGGAPGDQKWDTRLRLWARLWCDCRASSPPIRTSRFYTYIMITKPRASSLQSTIITLIPNEWGSLYLGHSRSKLRTIVKCLRCLATYDLDS